jgi:hypothetical protein
VALPWCASKDIEPNSTALIGVECGPIVLDKPRSLLVFLFLTDSNKRLCRCFNTSGFTVLVNHS